LDLLISLKSGAFNGVRVKVGRMQEMINTSCIDNLDFLAQTINLDRILPTSKIGSSSTERLKFEGDQSVATTRRNSLVGRIERKTLSLSFLENRRESTSSFTCKFPLLYF